MKIKKTIYFTVLLMIGLIAINSCSNDDDCTEQTWYQDSDGDGFGNLNSSESSCSQPNDFVLNSDDIDDTDANLNPNTVWQGDNITFTKANNADWTLEANQDRITDNVCITRANNKSIFNISDTNDNTSGDCSGNSPLDTEWAFGTIADGIGTLTFDSFLGSNFASCGPPDVVDQNAVLHLISDNIYIDIKFLSWSSGATGGGISYERSTMN